MSSLQSAAAMRSLALLLTVLIGLQMASSNRLKECGFTGIYCFGDSLYDTGNNVLETPNSYTGHFPYGITIGRPTGRFSDGLLIIDHIAEAAEIPYLNPSLNKSLDFSRGANFAVGGSGLLSRKDREMWNVTLKYTNSSLDTQMTWFQKLVKHSYKDPTALRDAMRSSLFVLGGGSADYTNVHAHYTGPLINQKKLILPFAIRALKQAVEVHNLSGYILILSSGAMEAEASWLLECTRGDAFPVGTTTPLCTATRRLKHTMSFITKPSRKLFQGGVYQYSDIRVVYGDVWAANQWVFDYANSVGIKNVNTACCGFGLGECGDVAVPYCKNPYEYMFWDGGHLTHHSYELMAAFMISHINEGFKCGAKI
ncbi:Acetylajmalan esterase [Linum perenne]